MIRILACALALAATAAPVPAGAQAAAPAPAVQPQVSITVRDLTPKFLAFYAAAQKEHASPERRFELWKQMYGFAAVPPTPEGDRMARDLLDHAWDGYPAVMGQIREGLAGFHPTPEQTLRRVAAVLQPDRPVAMDLLLYVGGLEKNAFTTVKAGVPTVAVSVEQDPADRGPIMTHEMVHAVQISIGSMSGGWIRTIGETVLAEGLAMRVTQHLYPDLPEGAFIERTPGWLKDCASRRAAILADVRSALASDKSEDVFRYTIGKGPVGVEREGYYTGWLVIDYWTRHGMSYARIARIPEAEAPARVAAAIDGLLAETQ